MIYADYTYYANIYKGSKVPENAWENTARQASAYLDQITYGRLKRGAQVTEDVKSAVCVAAETIYWYDSAPAAQNPGISSENVDGYSVNYTSQSAVSSQRSKALRQAVNLYLSKSDPLRFAGCYDVG